MFAATSVGRRQSAATARIVIIGAGAAGIAAATRLLEGGCKNVLILEAENRIGGRIFTTPFGDNVVDLGAQWCHGEKNNVVYETVQKSKLNVLASTGRTYETYKCIRSNREILDETLSDQLKAIVFETIPATQHELAAYEGSLGSYLSDKYWSEVEKLTPAVNRLKAAEFFENFKKFESSIEAADHLFEVSGKGYLEYWLCEGDLLLNWKDKGFKTFLDILLKSDTSKSWGVLEKRILLNHRVKTIDWEIGGENPAQITCFNGQVITADHVICSVSLGVLKEFHPLLFQPALPREKQLAIEGLKLGTVDKFFLEFKEPFGPADWPGMCFLWLEEDLKELRNSQYFWLESVFGFYRVAHQPRLLQGWIIGAHARHMETLPTQDVLNAILWLFRKFFTFTIPQPLAFKRSQWYTNDSFRGSYSFHSLHTDELRTGNEQLTAPITDDRLRPLLQFAGEATHNHYYSTVHGAVETGWREAQRLLDFYKRVPAQL